MKNSWVFDRIYFGVLSWEAVPATSTARAKATPTARPAWSIPKSRGSMEINGGIEQSEQQHQIKSSNGINIRTHEEHIKYSVNSVNSVFHISNIRCCWFCDPKNIQTEKAPAARRYSPPAKDAKIVGMTTGLSPSPPDPSKKRHGEPNGTRKKIGDVTMDMSWPSLHLVYL